MAIPGRQGRAKEVHVARLIECQNDWTVTLTFSSSARAKGRELLFLYAIVSNLLQVLPSQYAKTMRHEPEAALCRLSRKESSETCRQVAEVITSIWAFAESAACSGIIPLLSSRSRESGGLVELAVLLFLWKS